MQVKDTSPDLTVSQRPDLRHLHEPPVSAELRAIEAAWPGWHVWLGDLGNAYATRSRPGWCGVTVYAPTPQLVIIEIALQEREWVAADAREARRQQARHGWAAAA